MSASLHLNLVKEEELRSPNPVRLRVLFPILGVALAAGCLLWWMLLWFRAHTQSLARDTKIGRAHV